MSDDFILWYHKSDRKVHLFGLCSHSNLHGTIILWHIRIA